MRLSKRAQMLGESATLAVTRRAKELQASGVDVIAFGVGQPDFETPKHIRDAAKRALDSGHTGYAIPSSGILEARRAVCHKFAEDSGLAFDPSEIIITVGGKEGLYLAFMAVLDPGDEVIIPSPYWVSYPDQVRLAGGEPVILEGRADDGFCVTPEQLEATLTDRTRVLVLNYPSNPGGFTYSRDQLAALAQVIADRDVVVFSDEMYDRLTYDGTDHCSFAALTDRTRSSTITFNATSKSFAMTGWRMGYAAGPGELISAMAKLQSQTTSGVTHFCQYGLIAALMEDQACVETMRSEFDRRRRLMYDGLRALPGVECVEPRGAFYCFPDVFGCFERLGISGSAEFASRALDEAHVAVVPGAAFGADRHVRLAYAASEEKIRAGLDRLGKLLGH
jgi:aspartate aminotransferase